MNGLNKIFYLNNEKNYSYIVHFFTSKRYLKHNRSNKETTVDQIKAKEDIAATKKDVEDCLKILTKKKISTINSAQLLNIDTVTKIEDLLKYKCYFYLHKAVSIDSENLEELEKIFNSLEKTIIESLQKYLNQNEEISFIKLFDPNLYQKQYKEIVEELKLQKIDGIKNKLGSKLLKLRMDNLKKLQLKKIQDLEKQKVDERIAREKYEEKKRALEEQKKQFQKAIQDEEKRKAELKAMIEEEIRKREEDKRRNDAAIQEMKLTIMSPRDYRELCERIDKNFDKLSELKQALDKEREYKQSRTFFGTLIKGVVSLSIHTLIHYNIIEDLELQIKQTKETINQDLSKYRTLMKGEKHPRHDEI